MLTGLRSSLDAGQSISSWHMDHSVRLLRIGQNKKSERERGQEREFSEQKARSSYSLLLEVMSHHSLDSKVGDDYQEVSILGPSWRLPATVRF